MLKCRAGKRSHICTRVDAKYLSVQMSGAFLQIDASGISVLYERHASALFQRSALFDRNMYSIVCTVIFFKGTHGNMCLRLQNILEISLSLHIKLQI